MKGNFIITTTSTLEGYIIQKYLGTVIAHVVTGTGLFSDLAASISDLFGGRSKSYQKQLQFIQNNVLKELEENAKRLGANSIVGLKIDQDEISGKGKQMFMVTAYGSAILAKEIINNESSNHIENTPISFEELDEKIRILKTIEKVKNGLFNFDNNDIDLLIKHQNVEIASELLNHINGYIERKIHISEYQEVHNNVWRYFLGLNPLQSKSILYNHFRKDVKLRDFIDAIIDEGKLLDFDLVSELLEINDFPLQRRTAFLLVCYKEYYDYDDILKIENIINKLKNVFIDKSKIESKKGLLGSKDIWICGFCGKENDVSDYLYCTNEKCKRDKYGFFMGEDKFEDIIDKLQREVKILKEVFLSV